MKIQPAETGMRDINKSALNSAFPEGKNVITAPPINAKQERPKAVAGRDGMRRYIAVSVTGIVAWKMRSPGTESQREPPLYAIKGAEIRRAMILVSIHPNLSESIPPDSFPRNPAIGRAVIRYSVFGHCQHPPRPTKDLMAMDERRRPAIRRMHTLP